MKYIKQLTIILFISLVGEVLNKIIPLPIPASIYGLVILFIGLMSGVIKLEMVKETAKYLIEVMQIMFIPAGVGLLTAYDFIKDKIFIYLLITFLSTVIVMVITGKVADYMLDKRKEKC